MTSVLMFLPLRASKPGKHPKGGNDWAEGVNEASRVIAKAKEKAGAAMLPLLKKIQG